MCERWRNVARQPFWSLVGDTSKPWRIMPTITAPVPRQEFSQRRTIATSGAGVPMRVQASAA
ncbi:MAG: hypothetical protein DME08_06840 [Candidatus Rokuibacteriota bacterium]|nr:MAG: hypothetical protein DME08_06840 [Candidatus Rokubacteria bacterium]